MLPTMSNMGLQSAMGMQTANFMPAPALGVTSPTQFSATGIPTLDGQSYAYPPGSPMTSFMDDINNRVSLATRSPDGVTDITTWANGLVLQAQQRKQQQQALLAQQMGLQGAAGSGAASGAGGMGQMLQMLLSMLMSQVQQGQAA